MRIATYIIAFAVALAIWSTGCNKKRTSAEAPKIEPQQATLDPRAEEKPVTELAIPAPKPAPQNAIRVVAKPVATQPAVKPLEEMKEEAKEAEAPETSLTASLPSDSSEGFDIFLGAGHLAGVRETDRAFTQLQAEIAYTFSNEAQLGVGATAAKLYEIEPVGEKEFLLDDIAIFFRSRNYEAPVGTELKYLAGITLPISEASENSTNLTRATVAAELSKTLGRLTISATPYAQYYFNRYVSGESRVPSQRAAIGADAAGRIAIVRNRLDFVGWVSPGMSFYEEYDDQENAPTPSGGTAYGAYLDLTITQNISLQGGWVYGNSVLGDLLYTGGAGIYDASTNRIYAAIGIRL